MIIDHRYARLGVLKNIPLNWIDSAKEVLHIRYEHTSHGSQITRGMGALDAFMGGNGVFVYAKDGEEGVLDLHDLWESDLSVGEYIWQQKTRDYLDDPANQDCNVVMWSWCQIIGHDGDKDPGYCSKMEELIAEYGPGGTKILSEERTVPVQFVFMTGHLNGDGEEGETNRINNYIRNHCQANNRILFDFADIESYDPDDNYFLDKYCHDNCIYDDQGTDDGNWALEWIEGKVEMIGTDDIEHNEPNGGDWYQCYAAHTHPVNANMKAYAAWYMFARMAGWQPGSVETLIDSIQIYPEDGQASITTDEGSLQLLVHIFPDSATNKEISWNVFNGTGQAVIDDNGLLSAVENGAVNVVASALDGSGVSDTLEVAISNQITEVDSLDLSTAGNINSLVSADSLLLLVEIHPADADSQNVDFLVQSLGGSAVVRNNYVVGMDTGSIRIIAMARDGFGAGDTVELEITSKFIYIDSLVISGPGIIDQNMGSIQLSCQIYPHNASNPAYQWSVSQMDGKASISETGLLTAIDNGYVYAVAAAMDGSGIRDSVLVNITNQITLIEEINLSIPSGQSNLLSGDSILLQIEILPADADSLEADLLVESLGGSATLRGNYLIGGDPGGIRIIASARDGSGAGDTIGLNVVSTYIFIDSLVISGTQIIDVDEGSSQLTCLVYPADATDPAFEWSVLEISGSAKINNYGLLTAVENGIVRVFVHSRDGSGTADSIDISISNQITEVESISLVTEGSCVNIEPGDTLQLYTSLYPEDADSQRVELVIVPVSGTALLLDDGSVVGGDTGMVRIIASSTDGFGAKDSIELFISMSSILVERIEIKTHTGDTNISVIGGELKLTARIYPLNAFIQDVTWSVENITGSAVLVNDTILKAVSNGIVRVIAHSTDGSGIWGEQLISISGQETIGMKHIRTHGIVLFPNPARDYIIIAGISDYPADAEIIDISGKICSIYELIDERQLIDISYLHPGVYVFQIRNSIDLYKIRLIKH